MRKEPEFVMPYKAPLAEIPPGAKKYAEMAAHLKEAKRELRKAKREYKPDEHLMRLEKRVRFIELELEAHASGKDNHV